MIMRALGIAASVLALVATTSWAGDVTLTRDADLYRLEIIQNRLLLTITPEGEETAVHFVPQATGVIASSLNVGVDEASGVVIAAWQEGEADAAELRLAAFDHGTWLGPVTLDGGAVTPALYPELLMHRVASEGVTVNGDPVEIATSFAHLVWWRTGDGGESGTAMYGALRLDEDGLPVIDEFNPFNMRNLVPWGIGCHGVDDVSQLAHPKLFFDPQTGDPHVMATDFGSCLMQIVQLRTALDTDVEIGKRGRHVVLFGRTAVMGINPAIDMAKADIDVGHDLSAVLYWTVEGGIDYATLRESGWSDVKTLTLSENLSREEAIDLVRALAR